MEREGTFGWFTNPGFMPHVHCYLGEPQLVWTMLVTDLLIGIAYVVISVTLWMLVRKMKLRFSLVVICFGVFIGACGATHFMEVWTLWHPDYWLSAVVKAVTAVASVGTGAYLVLLRQPLVTVAEGARLSELRRLELEELTRELERRVAVRTADLEQAVHARDEFLSIASHELKTPLTSLLLQNQILLRGLRQHDPRYIEGEKSRQILELVGKQAIRVSRLVDDMLDITRIQTGQLSLRPERVPLGELAEEVIERMRPDTMAANCAVSLTVPAPVECAGDRLRIEQILNNLLTNALRYGKGKPVEVRVEKRGQSARITVRDHGIGIRPEDRERIFRRFERAVSANETSGLGLGLYIATRIVEGHGGRLWVESDGPGQGSSFIAELPLEGVVGTTAQAVAAEHA